MTGRHVVVIGGGLAGITAAVALRDAGLRVTLLESRPRLGGAASSYARGDLMVDNGQHVFLRCCEYYRDLLDRLGAAGSVAIQERFDVTVLAPDGPARLRRGTLPSPLHLAGALARYRLLSLKERASVARAALALHRADPARPELDATRLGDFLAARGQSDRARRMLWDLFVVSSLNIAGDEASVPLAAKVVRTGLLGGRGAADIGMATVPLGALHDTAAAALLAKVGAEVRLRARAAAIERQPSGGYAIRLTWGDGGEATADGGEATADGRENGAAGPVGAGAGTVLADGVVLAVPPAQAARLGTTAGLTGAASWDALGYSPIVNVHVRYAQPVMDLPFAAAVDSPVQWVFDKTRQAGVTSGQYLAVSLSAADEFIDVPAAALRVQFLPALERLFPAAAGTAVTDFFVTRERRATFRQAPGCARLRPGAATPAPGLVLAGAWTDTGWPDTMEGAVRSGHNAARQLISELTAADEAGQAVTPEPAGRGAL
jgi:squalene-associated FAD-dependent desaturase